MFSLILAICFIYSMHKLGKWVLNWINDDLNGQPQFTPEEIVQAETILTQIQIEMDAMEARRKLYDEALRKNRN
ncbi:hypothetical protein [Candidatus Enterococcus clewellii]|uniref:Uncharacterized protein n=1 Tax=Candidatus Enterococcus clewellii TaxID=1834193 RepID=A0AAQ3VUZ9_9ENTE